MFLSRARLKRGLRRLPAAFRNRLHAAADLNFSSRLSDVPFATPSYLTSHLESGGAT